MRPQEPVFNRVSRFACSASRFPRPVRKRSAGGMEKSVLLSKEIADEQKLANACAYVRFFSLDGLHALSSRTFEGFSSRGVKLVLGNRSLDCPARFRFEGGVLKVEPKALEVR